MIDFLDAKILAEKNWEILMLLTFNPASAKALVIGLLCAFVVMSIALAKMHGLGGSGSNSVILGAIVLVFGVFGLVQIVVLTDMLLLPLMDKGFRSYAYFASLVVGFFIFIVPMTKTFFRTNYTSSIGAWAVSIFLGGAVLMGAGFMITDKDDKAPSVESVKEFARDMAKQAGDKINKTVNKKPISQEPSPTPAPPAGP
ncbi:MAG: hypothetical protein SH807_03990 [Blastochloris sp.]|nr:hypothetical protein [Blastochloris sp.]